MRRQTTIAFLLAGTAWLPRGLAAQRPLDHDAYDRWMTIEQESLSRDGRWVLYLLEPQQGDGTLKARSATAPTTYTAPRGRDARFAPDGGYAVFVIKPEFAAVQAAKRAKKRGDDLPNDSLGILDLATGGVTKVAAVKTFQLPERGGNWVAYLLERPATKDTARSTTGTAGPKPKKDADVGTPLVLRNLASGDEHRFADVREYRFSRDGTRLLYAASSRLGDGDGVFIVDVVGGAATPIVTGRGTYKSAVFAEDGSQVAFLTDREDPDAKAPRFAVYRWRVGEAAARRVAASGTAGVPEGWTVSEFRAPSFSKGGRRLYFGTAPFVEPAPEDSTPDDERVRVDIWHWKDAELQSRQLVQLERARRESYLAVADLASGRVVQLADTVMTEIDLPEDGDGHFAVGTASRPYEIETSWDVPAYRDVYVVDLTTGARTLVLERTQAGAGVSPGGEYVAWYDPAAQAWFARSTRSGQPVNLTATIPYPLFDEEHDTPSPAPAYGSAGWTEGDRSLLIYDRYDVWALDPTGRTAARNLTDGVGRRDSLRFRVVDLDREHEAIPVQRPLLLSAFHYRTKQSGFYRDWVRGDRPPERLVFMERRFNTPRKADDADVLLFTRESVAEFPDLWVANLDLADARKLSDANPQQREYRWATAELVEWRSDDGIPLQGLLYKPDDFDPTKPYPLIVNFYERSSDNLYTHYPPIPHRSVIRPTFYASRGYVVFVPDIVYRIGYPGESALHAVVPGVLELVRRGFIDPRRIGVQGHSWGGYQIAYMVTKTNLFRAAAAGAPVANMASAYGGIRLESGMSRMFQYERTQSRIGASLWEAPLRYIENSPLFWADKIETPLLILHNDRDGAVPWQQGIELFTALRRLGKPAWMVSYNGEPHWPTTYANKRDWNIRMQQFFDHYLMDAPAPVWLAEGIPATEKGRTLGLELEKTR